MNPNKTTLATENTRLVCALLSGLAEANPQHADLIRERIVEIQTQNVLPTQYIDIVRKVNQLMVQDRSAWNTRLRLATTEIESLLNAIGEPTHLSPESRQQLLLLKNATDPLASIQCLAALLKSLTQETAILRQKERAIIEPSKKNQTSTIIANDIASASKRMLTLIAPLLSSLVKENPGSEEVEKLNRRFKQLNEQNVVDFFDVMLLVEDTSKQIHFLLSQRVSAESRFLSGIHEHLQTMHTQLKSVLESSGVLQRSSGKERERLDMIMGAFKSAAEAEDDPVRLKKLISENIDMMQSAVTTIIDKQSISHRQQERIIERLMSDIQNQNNAIQTMQQAHTSLANAAQRAQEDSLKDQLTGAFNRRAYDNYAKKLEEVAKKGGDVALVVLDIDRFKLINDSHGHNIGDKVLKTVLNLVSDAIKSSMMQEKTAVNRLEERCKVFRTGGEEFVITCAGVSIHQACIIADFLRLLISKRPMTWSDRDTQQDKTIQVTASFGVASFNAVESNADAVFVMADSAMYQAKREGRNQTWLRIGAELKKFQPQK